MQGFGGLDNCSLCGAEVEERGNRIKSLDDITYIFCGRCSRTRKAEIDRMVNLKD